MVRRAMLAAVAAWLAVVLVGATVVWAVISRTGQELVSGDALAQAGTTPSASAPPLQTTSPSGPIERRSAKPSAKPSRSSSPSSPETSAPSSSPTSAPSSPSGSGSRPPRNGGQPTSSPPPAPARHSGTWRERPGTVKVTCQGSTLRLDSLLPNAGWESELPEAHDGGLEVHFHRASGEGEVELKVWCSGGRPRFDAHGDND